MTLRVVNGNWRREFADGIKRGAGELRIVSPFIKAGALEDIRFGRAKPVRVITRFNLSNFADGVSDIGALRILLDRRASIRGIRNLHAKLYLFGEARAIVTSANLTAAGLARNHEFGIVTEAPAIIAKCLDYFEELWRLGQRDLESAQLEEWDRALAAHRERGDRPAGSGNLPDFGAAAAPAGPLNGRIPPIFTEASQAFVKLTGTSSNRCPLSSSTLEWVRWSGCHRAVNYSQPSRIVQDGDVMFISRLTDEPGMRIFGRAIATRHRDGIDIVSKKDLERSSWKKRWPYYVRLHDAEFLNGTMRNGISIYELTEELGVESFARTQERARNGERNIDIRGTWQQKPHIRLSEQGFMWLNERLQAAFERHGTIAEATLAGLDKPDLP